MLVKTWTMGLPFFSAELSASCAAKFIVSNNKAKASMIDLNKVDTSDRNKELKGTAELYINGLPVGDMTLSLRSD